MASFLTFLQSQFTYVREPTKDFSGQTIIVTGSNTGLGLEAARHFVKLHASKVILAVRSIDKGKEAKLDIVKSCGSAAVSVVDVWQLDMTSYASIKAFAKKCEDLERLDAIVENAGVSTFGWYQVDGMETTIRVNVTGTFLLALLMLPVLRKSGKKTGVTPRLTIVASEVHEWAKFEERKAKNIFAELNVNKPAYVADRYNVSKLLEVLTVRELAKHMSSGEHANEKVILNCVNPGLCHSSLARDLTGVKSALFGLFKTLIARKTDVGARTLVWASITDEESHGEYMSNTYVKPTSVFVRSEEGAKTQVRVYDELMEHLEQISPGISANI